MKLVVDFANDGTWEVPYGCQDHDGHDDDDGEDETVLDEALPFFVDD